MKKGKKLNSEILSVRSDKGPGGSASGFFMGIKPMMSMNNEPVMGSFDQHLHTMDLRQKDGEVLTYWADGGIRGAIKLAKVQEGQPIFIEHTGTKKIDEGTVQTYDVYGAEI